MTKTKTLEQDALNQYAVRIATPEQLTKLAQMEKLGWDVYRIKGQTPQISCTPYVEKGDGVIFLSSNNNPQKKLVSAKLMLDGQIIRL